MAHDLGISNLCCGWRQESEWHSQGCGIKSNLRVQREIPKPRGKASQEPTIRPEREIRNFVGGAAQEANMGAKYQSGDRKFTQEQKD